MNTRRILLFLAAFVLIFISGIVPLLVSHAAAPKTFDPGLIVPIPISGGGTLEQIPVNPAIYIKIIYQWGIGLAALIAMAQLVLGGVQYVISAGMPSAKNSAEERMTSAVTGLVILLSIVIILSAINPALLNIQLPALGNVKLQANALNDDDLINVSHERTTTATVADLKSNSENISDTTAQAAIDAAKGGKTAADDLAAANAARAAGVSNHGATQTEARKNPYYRAQDELASRGGLDACDDDLQDLKAEIDEYVSDPDMGEVVGPDGVTSGNGDFAEVLEEGVEAEQDVKTETDYEKALAQATVRCKRASVLLGVQYAREVFDGINESTFKKFANQMRKLPAEYKIDLYFDPKTEKLFGGF